MGVAIVLSMNLGLPYAFLVGEGTILCAVLGALIMTSIDNGISIMNVQITYQYIVKGLILLLAVWIDIISKRRSESA